MKTIVYLLVFVLIHIQALSQPFFGLTKPEKDIQEISLEIGNPESKKIKEVSKNFSLLPKPSPDGGNQRYAFSHSITNLALQQKNKKFEKLSEKNAKFALANIQKSKSDFMALPDKNWLHWRNNKQRVMEICPFVDKDGKFFDALAMPYQARLDTLDKKTPTPIDSIGKEKTNVIDQARIDSLSKVRTKAREDSLVGLLNKEKAKTKKKEGENSKLKLMVADSLSKSTTVQRDNFMKKSPLKSLQNALHDSVLVEFDVYEFDSISISVALVESEHNLGEYQSPKSDITFETGVPNVIIRWIDAFRVGQGDTLFLSLDFYGFADDHWFADGKLKILTKDPHGIAARMGLKVGDKFSNDTLAKLRCLNAEYCFKKGLEQTEAFMKNKVHRDVHIKVISTRWMSKDYRQEPGEQKGYRYRKQAMTLKYKGKK